MISASQIRSSNITHINTNALRCLYLCLFVGLCCVGSSLKAQKLQLSGSVYDFSNRLPIESVTVQCTCGSGTLTDSAGHYSLFVSTKDSVFFSYLGKNTMKYPVDTIRYPQSFEIGLHIDVKWLPEVKVQTHNYFMDSVENRRAYDKVFNYKKPGLELSRNSSTYVPGSVTVGLDLDA